MADRKNDVSTKDNDTHGISSKNNDSQPQIQNILLRIKTGYSSKDGHSRPSL